MSSFGDDLDLDLTSNDPTLAALSNPRAIASRLPPSASSSSSRPAAHAPPAAASSSTNLTATFKPDPAVPYFFPFLHLSATERAKGPKLQAKSAIELEAEKPSDRVTSFWRCETEYVRIPSRSLSRC